MDDFKQKARVQQIKFRTSKSLECDKYATWLRKEDAEKGLNFYEGFGVFDEVKKRFPKYKQGLYADILRSEHIPFNFFAPFLNNKKYCRDVLNDFLGDTIKCVEDIKIEYAPTPAISYLNDKTCFDVYIEYENRNGTKGIVGIEIKYTEAEYALKEGSKEHKAITNKDSHYHTVTEKSDLYKPDVKHSLIGDFFRQIWRNHILGESILQTEEKKFSCFTSIIIYPKGNTHFTDACKTYPELLKENNNRFLGITYEDFIDKCKKHTPDDDFQQWALYLEKRYLFG